MMSYQNEKTKVVTLDIILPLEDVFNNELGTDSITMVCDLQC